MDIDLMKQALTRAEFNQQLHFEALRPENSAVLEALGATDNVVAFFERYSFDSGVAVGTYHYDQANCFKKQLEWEDEFQRAAAVKLLVVGSALNGDLLVLDLENEQVGLLFHEHFLENENINPRQFLISFNCSIGHFFWDVLTKENYPIDAYEAAGYFGINIPE